MRVVVRIKHIAVGADHAVVHVNQRGRCCCGADNYDSNVVGSKRDRGVTDLCHRFRKRDSSSHYNRDALGACVVGLVGEPRYSVRHGVEHGGRPLKQATAVWYGHDVVAQRGVVTILVHRNVNDKVRRERADPDSGAVG